MTAQQLIDRALRLLSVVAEGQVTTAQQTADGLVTLNGMLNRWEGDGITLGFTSVTDAGLTLPLPEEAATPVAANLAIDMAPEYGVLPHPPVVKMATDGLRALERDTLVVPENDVCQMPGTGTGFNINTGS